MWKLLSRVQLFVTPWTIEFSRPEYWSGKPFPSPVDLPNPGIKPGSPALQVDSLPAELPGKPHISPISYNSSILLKTHLPWCVPDRQHKHRLSPFFPYWQSLLRIPFPFPSWSSYLSSDPHFSSLTGFTWLKGTSAHQTPHPHGMVGSVSCLPHLHTRTVKLTPNTKCP